MAYDHELPANLIPVGDICVPLFIPNDPDYVALLIRAIRLLELHRHYIPNQSQDSLIVREQWQTRTITPLISALESATGCNEANCVDFASNDAIISYSPQNPFTEPNLVPSGYLTTPFTLFSNFGAIGWLSSWLPDFTENLTGYQPNDVIVDISSLPLFANWFDLLSSLMPQISINVDGTGTMELHLINFPLGGRAIITIDTQPNLADIFLGILGNAELSVELNRDILSLPIESPSVVIHEVQINTSGSHTVYITFVPVLDDALIPLNFGGGLRKVVLCGFGVSPMAVEDIRLVDCNLEKFENGVWTSVADLSTCFALEIVPIQNQITINTGDIADNDTTSSDNENDIQDLQDSPSGNVYEPITPVAQTDIACQVSGYLVAKIGEYIAELDSYSSQPTLISALEAIVLGAFSHDFSPLVQVIDDLINGVILPLFTDYQVQETLVHEQIYCNNDFDKDSLASWSIANLTRGQDISDMISCISFSAWQEWRYLGEYASGYDCSSLCPPETWCHRFDFSIDAQGWNIQFGTIQAGGLRNETHAEGNGFASDSALDLVLLPNTTAIRVFSRWITTAFNTSSWVNVISSQGGDGSNPLIETHSGGWVGDGQVRDVTIDCSGWVGAYTRLQSGKNSNGSISGSPEGYIEFIELSGTGVNPYGSDNCL